MAGKTGVFSTFGTISGIFANADGAIKVVAPGAGTHGFLEDKPMSHWLDIFGVGLTVANSGGGYDWGRVGNALTAGGAAYYGLEKSISNSKYWVDAKGGIRSTELLERVTSGKYVRGVQGLRNSQAAAARAASNYAVAGKVVGGLGMFVTGYQFLDGQISGTEASIDLIMGGIGFTGWGTPVSLMYFGGKFLYEYSTGNTLFEKPGRR